LSEHSTLDILETGVQFMISHKGYQYAQKYADILLQKGASNANALYLSGILAQENGDLDRALSYFNRAKIIDPRLTQIYIESANIHEIKRQFDFALKTIEEGIRYNQDAFLFLKYAGKYLINKGKKKSAQDCLQRAYTINKYDDELEEILYILDNKNNTFGNRLNESKN